MTDASVLMDILRVVSDIKRPLQISVGDKDWTIDFPNKKLVKAKATNPELTISFAPEDFAALQT